ncbi:helix-hairpin-helix domain-containing protein [Streptomyces scabiei]|uniref:helix-hairpin-helix domain-containing protein n=1 Tax=Streptomyces scabiei TaxID=1930 RepID=UPI003F4CD37D
MALRPRSRSSTLTSGPGRGPSSDGRDRHRPRQPRGRADRRRAAAETLRLRAEALFPERAGQPRESGHGPPGALGGMTREAGGGAAVRGLAAEGSAGAEDPGGGRAAGDRAAGPRTSTRATVTGRGDVAAGRTEGIDEMSAVDAAVATDRSGSGRAVDRSESDRAVDRSVSGRDTGIDVGGRQTAGAWRERTGPALRERLPLWLQARCATERKSVVALSVVLLVAAVFAAQHFWAGRTQSVSAPEVVRAGAPDASGGSAASFGEPGKGRAAAAPGGPAGVAAPTGPPIVVDVGGKVRRPGVRRLPAGSRVADALRAAGGVRPGANTDGLNRARILVDGEQILVGRPAPPNGPGVTAGAGAAVTGAAPATPVSLNTATADQLDTLPGVGPVLAQHIIDHRTRHGGFRTVDELREVNGIGDRRFADLRDLVRP